MCERDRPETGCKLRSVFLLCAAALYHDSRTDPQRAHRAAQRASAMATGTIYHRARDSAPQRPQMACAEALPCASGYHRGTGTATAPAAALPWYTHHRHSLQRARVHIPTAATQSLTDSLSDGYRHNVPSSERQRASAGAQIHTAPAAATIGQPQRLPWYTPHSGRAAALPCASGYHRGTGTAHRAAQMACVFFER